MDLDARKGTLNLLTPSPQNNYLNPKHKSLNY